MSSNVRHFDMKFEKQGSQRPVKPGQTEKQPSTKTKTQQDINLDKEKSDLESNLL